MRLRYGTGKGGDKTKNVSPEAAPLKKRSLLQRIWEAESYALVLALTLIIFVLQEATPDNPLTRAVTIGLLGAMLLMALRAVRLPGWVLLAALLLIVVALRTYHRFYGDEYLIEFPTGSGKSLTLGQIAEELARRLTCIFLRDEQGRRPVFGTNAVFQHDPYWCDDIPFYEYFHGDTGAGIGASHQTGWTAVVANLLNRTGEK